MYYKRDMLLGFLCVAILFAVGWFCTADNRATWTLSVSVANSGLPHLTIPVDDSLEVLGLSFNGPGRPVLFVKDPAGDRAAIQYQDTDNDKVYEPAFVYDIKER